MQLSDIITASQLSAMRSAASGQSAVETIAPSITDEMRDKICSFSAEFDFNVTLNMWRELHQTFTSDGSAILCADGKSVKIMSEMHGNAFAVHMKSLLKRGCTLLFVTHKRVCHICWKNWQNWYDKFTAAPKQVNTLPDKPTAASMRKLREQRHKERTFYQLADPQITKKMGKRGYNLSFDEIRARQRMEAMERRNRTVVNEARKIYESAML